MNRDNDNEQPTVTVKSKFKAQRILYVAPSGMGKTFLLCQRVLQYIKEKRYEPKHIIIFASNHLTDKSLEPLIKRCSKAVKDF
jgi:ERCC4-related helicase